MLFGIGTTTVDRYIFKKWDYSTDGIYLVKSSSKQRQFAELLDSKFTLPGTNIKIGLDPIFGLITGFGDLFGASLSIYFMFHAVLKGAGAAVLVRMFLNIMADLVIGSIPVLGDIFDIAWKANLRNARLIDELEANPNDIKTKSSILNWLLFILFVSLLVGTLIGLVWAISASMEKLIA